MKHHNLGHTYCTPDVIGLTQTDNFYEALDYYIITRAFYDIMMYVRSHVVLILR